MKNIKENTDPSPKSDLIRFLLRQKVAASGNSRSSLDEKLSAYKMLPFIRENLLSSAVRTERE